MARSSRKPVRLSVVSPPAVVVPPVEGVQLARLVGAAGGGLLVRLATSSSPVVARSTVSFSASALADAVAREAEVLLLFAKDDPAPIVVGVLHAAPELAQDATREALVDGKRVTIEGHDEVVLQCGKASITLRRNGRVVIRGTQLESRARGVNRIRGGAVEIN